MTAVDWANKATELRLSALLWQSLAEGVRVADHGLGHLNQDYGSRIATAYLDMARDAEWTADQCALFAFEEQESRQVGRLGDEVRNGADVIALPCLRDGAA